MSKSSTIIIREGLVTYLPDAGTRTVSLSEFISNMSNTSSLVVPVLPSNCIGLISYPSYSCFVVQQAPRTSIMNFEVASADRRLLFNLHMPWVYYFITVQSNPIVIQSVCLAYAKDRVVNEDSRMGFMATPNISARPNSLGSCCLGEVRLDNNLPVNRAIEDLIAKIVASNYNNDLFNPHSQNKSPFLLNAYSEYGTTERVAAELAGTIEGLSEEDALAAVPTDHILRYFADHYHSNLGYLYAWQKKSEELELNDFVAQVDWDDNFSYKGALENMEKGIRNGQRRE